MIFGKGLYFYSNLRAFSYIHVIFSSEPVPEKARENQVKRKKIKRKEEKKNQWMEDRTHLCFRTRPLLSAQRSSKVDLLDSVK